MECEPPCYGIVVHLQQKNRELENSLPHLNYLIGVSLLQNRILMVKVYG
jgi:hypothetical protein